MISFSNRIVIAVDPSEVFTYLSNPIHIPEWNYYVEQVIPLDGDEPRVGSRYQQRRRTDQQILVLAEFRPPTRLVLRTLHGQRPAFTRTLTLAPLPDGRATDLTDHWKLDTGQPLLIQQLTRPTVRHAVRDNLGKLAELLETGTTLLQEGRVSARARPAASRRP